MKAARLAGAAIVMIAALFSLVHGPAAQAATPGKASKPGTVFKDCRDCPEMVVVPPGRFMMGREGGEKDRYEGPVHEVTIGYAFAAGRFELTNGQYRRFVEATGHKTAGTGCNVFFGDRVEAVAGSSMSRQTAEWISTSICAAWRVERCRTLRPAALRRSPSRWRTTAG